MTPTQPLKPSEIAIRGDQFTAVLDGQCRHISISDQRPSMALQIFTNRSQCVRLGRTRMARGHSTSLRQNAKAVCIGVAGRKIGICHDSQEAGKHDLRDRERFRRLDQSSKPRRVSIVLRGILPMP